MTTQEAAAALGVSVQRVRAMIKAGRLPATKHGRDWIIRESDLSGVKVYGKPGRPRKSE
jgi:excisionase family DNA binding protein